MRTRLRGAWAAAVALGVLAIPYYASQDAGDGGKALYEKKCAMCHGKDGVAKAMAKGSANLNDPGWQKATPLEAVVKIVTEGKDKMPAYDDKLSPEQIRAVATYVKRLE
jgi:cytochrome c6